MGIAGLLPFLEGAIAPSSLEFFAGKTVAVDAYVWLHRGATSCARELALGLETTAFVSYCLKYLDLLLFYQIRPIIVFDGRNLPSKQLTEKKRHDLREMNLQLGKSFLSRGMEEEAQKHFVKSVDVTPTMARQFIAVLRARKIDYIVSPYEADAQLAFLALEEKVDLIITEDSDLIVYGAPLVLFKLKMNGEGMLYDQSKLASALQIDESLFQFHLFRKMAILSGCDYLQSLRGIGLVRGKQIAFSNRHNGDISKMLQEIPKLFPNLNITITEDYIDRFIKANLTFKHQLVFNPGKRLLQPLHPYQDGNCSEQLDYAGEYLPENIATQLSLGNLDFEKMSCVDNFEPTDNGYPSDSIWNTSSGSPKLKRPKIQLCSASYRTVDDNDTSSAPLFLSCESLTCPAADSEDTAGETKLFCSMSPLGQASTTLTAPMETNQEGLNVILDEKNFAGNAALSVTSAKKSESAGTSTAAAIVSLETLPPHPKQKYRAQGLLKSASFKKNTPSVKELLLRRKTL